MTKPDEKTKNEIRNLLLDNPSLSAEFIADKYHVSKIIAAAFKRGMRKREMFNNIDIKIRKKIRDEYKSGHLKKKNIIKKYKISESEAELIRKEVNPNTHNLSDTYSKLNTIDKDKKYIYSFDIEDLYEILIKTALAITREGNQHGFLLYRQTSSKNGIREIEVQHIMSNILSEYGYFHIIENPTPDFRVRGRTDLSVCSQNGSRIVDIEFKINESDIRSDFFKFFRSDAFGVVSFFISVDSNLVNVCEWYEAAYQEKLEKVNYELFIDKWFLLFCLSISQKIAFVKFYDSLKSIRKGSFNNLCKCKGKNLIS